MSQLDGFDFAVIGCYLAAVLAVGVWTGRRVRSFEEYAVAGRSYSTFMVFATLSAIAAFSDPLQERWTARPDLFIAYTGP